MAGPTGATRVVLRPRGSGWRGVRATLDGPVADRPDVLRTLGHLLDLDRDRRPAEEALSADPALGPLVRRRPGLRIPGDTDAAQTLLATVVGQQVSLAAARTLLGRLCATYGRRVDGLLVGLDTARLATADPADLPLTRARGRSLVAVAGALTAGLDAATAREDELLALPGVGAWTAAYVRLRSGRDPDVFLATDLAARRQAGELGLPERPRELAAVADRWRPYRSLALLHLWTDYLEDPARDARSAPTRRVTTA